MKPISIFLLGCILTLSALAQDNYTPTPEVLQSRKDFQDMKYGMFIHWGASSVLGDGEWVMNTRKIRVNEYKRLIDFFNPQKFDAKKWVALAKASGMKYITFVSRHHDSFSNWDTKQSDWKITKTPYSKDVVKMLADECHAQGIKLFLYYSTLDWFRNDYPHESGRTGQFSGRPGKGDYASYLKFMKAQLTELLTNYGEISGIWFDGHWDQTNPEGQGDRTSRIDWKYDEIYSLIHKLQPQCMIGNNHHLSPIPGEDFQMFERDLPGENKAGYSFQKPSDVLPLETCETLNGSWGFNITDRNYKTPKQVVHYLINAAGRNANLLLNIGPMPDGNIQSEFVDTLLTAGKWLEKFGNTIYGTRAGLIPIQPWGVATTKENTVYLHVLNKPESNFIVFDNPSFKIKSAKDFVSGNTIKFKQTRYILSIPVMELQQHDYDGYIIELQLK